MTKRKAYFISFLISLTFYVLITFPQVTPHPAQLVLGFFYVYAWLIPISLLIIYGNSFYPISRLFALKGKYRWIYGVFILISLVLSYIDRYSNDAVITLFWISTLFVWMLAYFRLVKNKSNN